MRLILDQIKQATEGLRENGIGICQSKLNQNIQHRNVIEKILQKVLFDGKIENFD